MTMFLRVLRGTLLLAASALMIPYTIAVVCNILHGWPQCRFKYRRALNPRKVFRLNYVLFQMLRDKTKYLPLYLKWNKFYRNAHPRTLHKNLIYGRNDCSLDVYLPKQCNPGRKLPVVIFVYGGAWSSGDKASYGLLCSNIAAHIQAVVVCPNYSVYPKGYVDDMIQDIVDSIVWVIDNIEDYGGNKNKLILLGHSAGAHLAIMAVLELLHDERLSVKPSFKFQPAGTLAGCHYQKSGMLAARLETLEDSSGSSESFAVVNEIGSFSEQSGTGLMESSSLLDDDIVPVSLNLEACVGESLPEADHHGKNHLIMEVEDRTWTNDNNANLFTEHDAPRNIKLKHRCDEPKTEEDTGGTKPRSCSGSVGDDEEEHDDDSGDNDSVVTVRPKDLERHATLVDMCKSVKAFIEKSIDLLKNSLMTHHISQESENSSLGTDGLAGVYSISDHFQHETMRGIEDISCMCRVHYGEDHFDRFSPKEIIRSLGRCLSLPLMVLVHGMEDYISPLSSTLTFSDALADISSNVKVKVIPECDHYEICLDLMDKHRKFYGQVMNVIMETVSAVS